MFIPVQLLLDSVTGISKIVLDRVVNTAHTITVPSSSATLSITGTDTSYSEGKKYLINNSKKIAYYLFQ